MWLKRILGSLVRHHSARDMGAGGGLGAAVVLGSFWCQGPRARTTVLGAGNPRPARGVAVRASELSWPQGPRRIEGPDIMFPLQVRLCRGSFEKGF